MRYPNTFTSEPLERELIIVGKEANVYVRENIESHTVEDENGEHTEWTCIEHHRQFVATPNFAITDALVEQMFAADYADEAKAVRAKRNLLLEESDKEMLIDRIEREDEQYVNAVKAYRQALRDIPEQEGFPYDVVYPTKP